jgi:hypothetical protein
LVPKSAGTACGPNTASSTVAAFLIDKGIANVQAMIQRMSGDLIEIPRNTGDSSSWGWVKGARRASPPTRSGWFKASASAMAPPNEWPTTSGRCRRSAAANFASVCAWAKIAADACDGRVE